LIASGCLREPDVPEFEVNRQEWSYGEKQGTLLATNHFDIYTTVSDVGLLNTLPEFLECAYEQYTALIPPTRKDGARLTTYLFETQQEWAEFAAANYPARFPTYERIQWGGFAENDQAVVFYLRRPETLSVMAHEGMHQYLSTQLDQVIPAWLNEGLACYCESFDFEFDVPVFRPLNNTFRLNGLREALAAGTLMPLDELLNTHAGAVIDRSHSRLTKTYYAQAWSFVAFLNEGEKGKYQEDFRRMLREITDGTYRARVSGARFATARPSEVNEGRAVLYAYLTDDFDRLESEYRNYLMTLALFQ
jgi:hypothetical protein